MTKNPHITKAVRLAAQPASDSAAGMGRRKAAIRRAMEAAVQVEADRIRSTDDPRCGTCGGACDPWKSDEGYSLCCNDRIEYSDEWKSEPNTIWNWAVNAAANRAAAELARKTGSYSGSDLIFAATEGMLREEW